MKIQLKIKSSNGQTGFTLLEMMIVVVVIGIFAAMAGPTLFNSIPKMKARSDARIVLSSIRLARSKAVSENSQYGIYFDVANNKYWIFKDIQNPSLLTYESGDSLVSDTLRMANDVSITGSSFANNCIIFFSNGGASGTGSIGVNDCSGNSPYSISVLASTGKARMQ